MYCANCGSLAESKLKYCKNCGSKLGKEDADKGADSMLNNILTTLFLIVMFGLGILVGLVAVLLGAGVEPKFVMFIAIGYLAAVFGICYTLLTQVPKLIDAKLNKRAESPDFVPPAQLYPRTTAQLEEQREPVISVTEHTTRTLDKVPLKEN